MEVFTIGSTWRRGRRSASAPQRSRARALSNDRTKSPVRVAGSDVRIAPAIETACSDGPTAAPRRGTILVSTQTSGGDPDLDGYNVVLDTNAVRILPVNG